jgi:hypothetical protein
MMKSELFRALALIQMLLATPFAADAVEIFVAKNGDDHNSGTQTLPLKTIVAARNKVRDLRSNGTLQGEGAIVSIRGGIYEWTEPLHLDKEDSGTTDSPVIYRAAPGEKVHLTGARRVVGFAPVSDTRILERIRPEARGHVHVADLRANGIEDLGTVATKGKTIELFFRDKPMQLSRWPDTGFVQIKDVVGNSTFKSHGIPGTKEGWFTYEENRQSQWNKENDAWLHGYWFWDWSDSFEQIESIDPATKTIKLHSPYHHYGYRNGQRYYALNLLAELDQPGEWYIDRQTNLLYFWPPDTMQDGDVRVSVLSNLVQMESCEGVVFRDLIFEGTRSTAIEINESKDCRVEQCTVRNTGSWGVVISGGSHCEVKDSELYALGEGGISLSGGDRPTLTPAGHASINNHIHHFGRIYRTYRPAVGVSGVGNRVAQNEIHDGPHNAIQLGGNDHIIELNEIYKVCFETGDVGAFYMGRDWTQRGTIIRHNYFHDIRGPGLHGAMAVYLDDAASGIQIIGNVFYRAGRAAFIGGGRDNLVQNNIFVDCEPSVHVDARGVGWMHETISGIMPERLRAVPYRQSPWKERYPQLLTLFEDEPGRPKYNVIRRNISWGGTWLNAEKAAKPLITFENNLIDTDPLFEGKPRSTNGNILDFRLPPNSPAFDIGFEKLPLEKIGRQNR